MDINATSLIENVRAGEDWIHGVQSFVLRMEGGWTRTPQGIAARRAELRREFPHLEESDLAAFSDLQPRSAERLEIIFDANRLRYSRHQFGSRYELAVWDGQRAISQCGRSPGEPEGFTLDVTPRRRFEFMLSHLGWLRARMHSFWWNPIDAAGLTESFWGPVEEFKLKERRQFHGVDCHVLEGREGFRRWYVGVTDQFLHGIVPRVLAEDSDAPGVIAEIARRRGQQFKSHREYYRWRAAQPLDERRAMDREYHAALLPASRPQVEHVLLDYRELAPGSWFPMTQTCDIFLEEPDEAGAYGVAAHRELRAVEVKVNERLPDGLFRLELVEGVHVYDQTHDPPLHYRYQRNMPTEKWEAIVATAQEREAEKAARDALIGQAPPAFPMTEWVNSEPLAWDALRGQVVILDFWSESCGACRGDLPKMADLHMQREETGITVLGIHTPDGTAESIGKVVALYDLRTPICIDAPPPPGGRWFGRLTSQFGVRGIPHAFVIDREGKIAGHGSLDEALMIARGLWA